MKVGSIGYNYERGREYWEDRTDGIGCHLLLLVKSDGRFFINGRETIVKKPSYVLIRPDTSVEYGSYKGEYCEDWIYMNFGPEDEQWVKSLGIKLDECVEVGNIHEFSALALSMTYEHYLTDEFHEKMEERYLEQMFLLLARRTSNGHTAVSEDFSEKDVRFKELRVRMYHYPRTIGTIDEIASELNISRSGLQHYYKQMFGVPLSKDMINARLNYCAILLATTDKSLHEMAIESGYQNEFYFMRQFKEKYKMTPSEYRVMCEQERKKDNR